MATETLPCALERNLAWIIDEISATCERNGRRPDAVTLVAASKTVEPERLQRAIDLGQRVFGENRVQEGILKWPTLREANPDIELHLVGPLQSNKARDAVSLFDVIQSVDRTSVARAIAKERDKQGRAPTIYIQVNTGREPQKSGVLPEDTGDLIRSCREDYGLDVAGLMCIPAVDVDPSNDFGLLRDMARDEALPVLSMGMSGDYIVAIGHGATHVRVGSAIFGARPLLKL
jgi:pyridoxal phosphate enzyme (YggS family)